MLNERSSSEPVFLRSDAGRAEPPVPQPLASLANAANQALSSLCGRGPEPPANGLEWLEKHAEEYRTQFALNHWAVHPEDGPQICRCLQQACRRGKLQHPQMVAYLLSHAPWEPLLDDAQLLPHIGARLSALPVFRALADRAALEEGRTSAQDASDSIARMLAHEGNQARRRLLWDSIIRPHADGLRLSIVRQGALELLRPLLALLPAREGQRQLQNVVREVSVGTLHHHSWLRERISQAGIAMPDRLVSEPVSASAGAISALMRTTYRRGMQADDVSRTLALVQRASMAVRFSTLDALLASGEGPWACSFVAQAMPADAAVHLWGSANLDDLMHAHALGMSCPLLAFGAAIAGVLIEVLPQARAEALIVRDHYSAVLNARDSGQASVLVRMATKVSERHRGAILALVRSTRGEEAVAIAGRPLWA